MRAIGAIFLLCVMQLGDVVARDRYQVSHHDYVQYIKETHRPKERFSDIFGQELVKKEAAKIVDMIKNHSVYQGLGGEIPNLITIQGPKGSGRTLLAKAIAGEADAFLFFSDSLPEDSIDLASDLAQERAIVVVERGVQPKKRVYSCCDSHNDESEQEYKNNYELLLKAIKEQTETDAANMHPIVLVRIEKLFNQQFDPFLFLRGMPYEEEDNQNIREKKIYVSYPDQPAREGLLKKYFYDKDVKLDPKLCADELVQKIAQKTDNFGAQDLKNLVNEAALCAGGDSSSQDEEKFVTKVHFDEAYNFLFRDIQTGKSGGFLSEGFYYTHTSQARLSDVIGIDEVLEEIEMFMDGIKNAEKYKASGIGRPKGLVLYGKPGVGKTLLARAMAGETGCCFISASASQFVQLYVGSGALAVRNLFDFARKIARHKHVVIFIDELDACGKRSDGSGGSQEYNNTINELLTQLDGFAQDENISVVGATNNIDLIDNALLREGRFDIKIKVPLPRLQSREKILKYYLKKIKTLDLNLCAGDIASKWAKETVGYSGAALESFVNKAASLALNQNYETVQEKHFEEAYLKSVLGLKNNVSQKKEDLQKTAEHEAGHTLVSVLTGHEVSRVSILSRGGALGAMFQKDKHEVFSNNSRDDLLNEVKVLLGGFCAEKLLHGAVTPGAWDDLRKANRLVSDMINIYGMDDGALAGVTSDFIKSDVMKVKFDQCMMNTLQKCRNETQKLLEKNKKKLVALAQALFEKETLLEQEIYAIVGGPK